MLPTASKSLVDVLYGLNSTASIRLRSFMGSMERGNAIDLRTMFYQGSPRDEIVASWGRSLPWKTLTLNQVELERNEIKKIGPMSVRLPWTDRRDSLDPFYSHHDYQYSVSALNAVLEDIRGMLPKAMPHLSLHEAYNLIPNDTNVGLPYFTTGQRDLPRVFRDASTMVSSGEYDFEPWVAGTRTQQAGPDLPPKQRLLWITPGVEKILGKSVEEVILREARKWPQWDAWRGPEAVNDGMADFMSRSGAIPIYSTDQSQFDATLLASVMYRIMMDLINYWCPAPWLEEQFRHIAHGPILTPDGLMSGRTGGLASGSALTQLIGTLYSEILVRYLAQKLSVKLLVHKVLGDDQIAAWDPSPPVDEVAAVYKELGVTMNPGKTSLRTGVCHYLQNLHDRDFTVRGRVVGVRSTMRMLGRLMSLETLPRGGMSGPLMAVRAVMIAETTKYSPVHEQFTSFLYWGDELLRDLPWHVILARAGGAEEVQSVFKQPPHSVLGGDVAASETFETVIQLERLKSEARGTRLNGAVR